MRVRTGKPGRRGTVLVYFAFMVFALMGIAALVIDLGMALATRRQMQTAADTAALEGLRARDAETDQQRRQDASTLVTYHFDDNLNPQDGDPWPFSAGPVVQFSGGLQFGAAQTLTVGPPYKPVLQLNLDNDMTGDLVSGTYIPGGPPVENADYSRTDFTPDPAGSATPGNAFLVRLRRTGEAANPGISLPGPPLPYLFGRGSLLAPDTKLKGILVRATAIADGRRVLSVGTPNADTRLQLVGVAPFVLLRTQWESETVLPTDTAVSITADAAGSITVNGTPAAGYTFTPAAVSTMGQVTAANSSPLDLTNYRLFQYVPVVQDFAGASGTKQRIIGFGRIDLSPDPANPGQFLITKRQNKIAAANASIALVGDLDAELRSDPNQLSLVLTANLNFAKPLLAPALVR
jgi:Putative Flp pilus-assembly TadE/G-like